MRWFQSLVRSAFAVLAIVSAQFSKEARAAEPAPDTNSGKIVVRVIDASGAPLADAVVTLFRYDPALQSFKTLPPDTTTDSSGITRADGLTADNSYYVVRAKTPDGLVGYRDCRLDGANARARIDVTVLRSVVAKIRVHDESGKPVMGAMILEIKHSGIDGSMRFDLGSLIKACGLSCEPSNATGDLLLPELPSGKADIKLIHRDYAPTELKDLTIASNAAADAILPRGVRLTLRVKSDKKGPPVDGFMMNLSHVPDEHPSTLYGHTLQLQRDGTAQLTVAPGKYFRLGLTHPDYFITPEYLSLCGHGVADEREYFEIAPGADEFVFQVHRKVKIRTRALDAASGKPIANVGVLGYLQSDVKEGPFMRFARDSEAGHAETNDRGEFEIELAAGRASLLFASGHCAWPTRYSIDVPPNGPAVARDILIKPVPKVRGVVQDQQGKPLAGVVVRFRGSELNDACRSALTDSQGRFEMAPDFVPTDWKTEEPRPEQTLVAFDPYKPLAAEVRIHLDESTALDNVLLRMKPQDYDALITGYPDELSPWERGVIPSDEKAHLAAMSLAGKPAPELDGSAWLNTDKPKLSLADFRGKYVLLQFWTTWCGVCHWDLPNLKVTRDLYKDRGLVVIGVHDNSMPLEAIKEDAGKNGMSYPIVVDRPDGRILASYRDRGFQGFPSYILIGPDGRVIKDDATVAGPSLFSFKTEIIRQMVMTHRTDDH